MENNTPVKRQLPAYVILGIIALVAALVLALTNAITSGPIAEHAMKALRESFSAVMPADEYVELEVSEEHGVRSLYEARTGGEVAGWCVTAAGMGYNGEVAVTLGVDTDGLVTGCAVGDTSFAETPGFGARAKEAWFQDQFVGLDAVNGGAFEAISGATITSDAVREAVNKALACVDAVALEKAPAADPLVVYGTPTHKPAAEAEEKAPAAPLTGAVQKGSAKGFQSDVQVELTVDATGAVSGLTVNASGETPNFGTRCNDDEAFIAQFLGKAGPFAIGEGIDALAGATVTSKAVVEAINNALTAPASAPAETVTAITANEQAELGVNDSGAAVVKPVEGYTGALNVSLTVEDGKVTTGDFTQEAPAAPVVEEAPVVEQAPAAEALTGEAQGFASAVKVTVTLNEDDTIATLTVDASGETPNLGTKCAEEAFTSQFIGKKAPFSVNIDSVSSATITSEAVVSALNSVLPAEAAEGTVLQGEAKGFDSTVKVSVTMGAEGKIAALTVDASGETPSLGTKCAEEAFTSQFVGKTGPFSLGIDGVSSATVTSQAVADAINSAVGQ